MNDMPCPCKRDCPDRNGYECKLVCPKLKEYEKVHSEYLQELAKKKRLNSEYGRFKKENAIKARRKKK